MSLATRCTACGTVFRVVEDQLKVSEGWVRCGRCQQVFNAVESLFDLEREAPPPWTPPPAADAADAKTPTPAAAAAPVVPAARSAVEVAYAEYAHDPAADSAPVDLNLNLETPPTNPSPGSLFNALIDPHPPYADSISTGDVDIDLDALPESAVSVEDVDLDDEVENDIDVDIEALAASVGASTAVVDIVLDDGPADGVAATPVGSSAPYLMREAAPLPMEPLSVATTFDGTDSDAEGAAPSFVTQAERQARWRRSPLRLSYAVAGLLLCLVLLLQIGLHFRDALAAAWPEARGLLAGLCQIGGCKIEPPRRIDSITVESSGLVRNADNSGYRLSVVLNNRAAYALAIPSVDLSLTDGDGQVMSRRVLSPADFKPAVDALKASGVTTLELTMTTSTKPIAGYTVEIFYP